MTLKSFATFSSLLAVLAVTPALAQQNTGLSLGANYTYVRTNLTPDCNCFGLNGGGIELQYNLTRRVALLGDITAAHTGNVTVNRYDLTQVSYAGGIRYFPLSRKHLQPFADVMLGGAHASGSLSPSESGHGSSNAFLFEAGGGLGIPVADRWTFIPIRASYVLTTFPNGYADRQDDLRLSVGVRVRLGHK